MRRTTHIHPSSVLVLLCALCFQAFPARAGEPTHYELIKNNGQWPSHVLAQSHVSQGQLYLERGGLTWNFMDLSAVAAMHGTAVNPAELQGQARIRGHVFKTHFVGANEAAEVHYVDEQITRYNYFIGQDASRWQGDVPAYGKLIYKELYPGIDLHFYSQDFSMKYDFMVDAGADASAIALRYEGVDGLALRNGRLIITTSVNEVIEQAPVAWQNTPRGRVPVACEYVLKGDELRFHFPKKYDPNYPLVIDPILLFSTYSGSTADNFGFTATYDEEGYLYSGSSAFGAGYPLSVGAYQEVWGGGDGQGALVGTDIAITKYDISGTFRVYSTYLGGANDELPHSLIVNPAGELIVMGTSSSPNYPITAGVFQPTFNGGTNVAPSGVGVQYVNGSDIVVTRFSANGNSLLSSTFLGGSDNDGVNASNPLKFNYADEFRGEVELDNEGNILIVSCTFSTNFPVVDAIQPVHGGALDGCITKFTPDLSSIIYSTYLGSTSNEGVYSVAVTSNNALYVCGGTISSTFPTTSGSYQTTFGGGTSDGFLAMISAEGDDILYSTFIGSAAYDQAYFVETDDDDVPYIYGQTRATGSTFIINAGYGTPNSGMLVAKFQPDLSAIIWSTVFGTGSGKPNLSPTAFLVDVCGKIYLSGWGGSTNTSSNINTDNVNGMEVTPDAFQQTTNGSDFYLLVLEDDASDVVYASFFGGNVSAEHVDGGTSRFNRKGQIYQSVCAGCGSNDDFPIFPANAVSPTNNSSNCNNGVFKFDFLLPITIADFNVPLLGCLGGPATFQNTSANGQSFFWDFGDGTTSESFAPTHTYTEPGTYEVMLVAFNSETCNAVDTLYKTITLIAPQSGNLNDLSICEGESVTLGPESPDPLSSFFWTPFETLNNPAVANPVATPTEETLYTLLINNGVCVDTLFQFVGFTSLGLDVPEDVVLCNPGDNVVLTATTSSTDPSWIWSANADFSDPLNLDPNDASIQVSVTASTTYYVQLTIGNCVESAQVNVGLLAELLELEPDFTVCAGDTVTLTALNPLPGFTLTWSPADLIVSGQGSTSVQAFVPEDQIFTLVATNGDCEVEADIFVSTSGLDFNAIQATATPDLVLAGESTVLTATPVGFDYQWSPSASVDQPNAATTTASPTETTTYTVTISDGDCIYTDAVQVRVFDFTCGPPNIYVPNAFTPNSDNLNELLYVRGNYITDLYFVIYNRWGEKIFETRSLNEGWDGTYKGRDVDPAVFVYYLEAVCEDGQNYFDKGNITVIR